MSSYLKKRKPKTNILKPMLEKDIQKMIVQWLKLQGLEVSVTDASRSFAKDGGIRRSKVDPSHPDLTVVLPVVTGWEAEEFKVGLAFYIEVKTPSGQVKEGQKEKLLSLCGHGAVAIVARDLDVVETFVKAFRGKRVTAEKMRKAHRILWLQLQDRRNPEVGKELAELLGSL